MGYAELYGGGTSWQAYRWQQDTVLAAGYSPRVLGMGMPGWAGNWGSGGLNMRRIGSFVDAVLVPNR